MTYQDFMKGVAIFTACVKDFPIEGDKLKVWFELLKHLDSEIFFNGVKGVCQTEPNIYPGTNIVALILEKVKEVLDGGVSLETKSLVALDKFDKGFHNNGFSSKSVIFDDPVIHAVVESMGGWMSLEDTLKEDWKWKRKEFKETYIALYPEVLSKRLEFPEVLKGRDRLRNQGTQYKPPIFIGDAEKAIEWVNERRALEGRTLIGTKSLGEGEQGIS